MPINIFKDVTGDGYWSGTEMVMKNGDE